MLKRPVRPASPSRCQSRAAPRASLSTLCPPCTCLSRGSPALAPRPAGAPPPQRCVHRSVRPPGPLSSRGRGSWVPPPTSVPFRPASPLSERRRGVGRRTCRDLSSSSPGAGAHGSEGSGAGSPGCAGWGGGPGRPRARPREQPHLAQAPTSSCATSHLASLCPALSPRGNRTRHSICAQRHPHRASSRRGL